MEFGKRKKRKILVNITSLIDVMFLLLIFFAVTSTFLEHPGITVELPAAGSSEVIEKKEIMITVTRDETIHLNGEEIKKNQFEKKLGSLVKNYKDPVIMLKADKNVTYGLIIELMDSIRRLGLKKVVAFTKIDLTKPLSPSEKLKL